MSRSLHMPLGCIYWPGWGITLPGSFASGICIYYLLQTRMERAVIHMRLYDATVDAMDDLDSPSICLTLLDEKGINGINADGCTLLSIAVRNNYSNIVEYLISAGADVNARESGETGIPSGATPIFFAQSGKVARLLIEAGADVSARDNNDDTPLHWIRSVEAAEALLRHGADVNARNNEGRTPVHITKSGAFARLFLQYNADVNARDNDDRTPLHWMMNLDAIRIYLENGADVNARDQDGETPVFSAVSQHNRKWIQLLKDFGADINARDRYGKTPLESNLTLGASESYRRVQNEFADLLISLGAKVDEKDAFILAAMKRDFEIVKSMLSENPGLISTKNYIGQSVFIYAAQEGFDGIVELFLSKGADINEQEYSGTTALMAATEHGNFSTVKLLLANRAEINAKAKDGKSALVYAEEKKYRKIADLLRKSGALERSDDDPSHLFDAIKEGDIARVETMLNRYPELVNARDGQQATALIRAVMKHQNEIARLLISRGADVNAKDRCGYSALGNPFCIHKDREIVEILIKGGADVNATDNDGNTVLDHMKSQIRLGITPRSVEALLRSHGARSANE